MVINQAITIPFVLDSGAAEVQLPAEVVFTLIRTGTLSEADFLGEGSYVHASGATFRSPRFNIREMRVGGHVVRNVAATVGPAIRSDALLGQSFLSKLPSWTLDNKRHVLILARAAPASSTVDEAAPPPGSCGWERNCDAQDFVRK